MVKIESQGSGLIRVTAKLAVLERTVKSTQGAIMSMAVNIEEVMMTILEDSSSC
jgi:hypothetical protein